METVKGIVFDIEKFAVVDGPGIRTTVFLKGCPLRCIWCHNPESQEKEPETLYAANLCVRCGTCVRACPEKALTVSAEGVRIDRTRCTGRLSCAAACPTGAMKMSGREMSAKDVFEEAAKNKDFYRNSGGGVTVSGGEPLMQWPFVKELFRLCRDAGIHTALDTCGQAPAKALREVLKYTDLVMYDVKEMDPARHKAFTGVSNRTILNNLRMVAESGVSYFVRIPLIPGRNATRENIAATGDFLKTIPAPEHIELLPYHNMGRTKHLWVKGSYGLDGLEQPSGDEVEALAAILRSRGFEVQTGG